MDVIKDTRVGCFSVMVTMTVEGYLEAVEQSYRDRGGVEGQREALKTRTALQIRKRMIEDLGKGTVLPPIVLGIVDKKGLIDRLDRSQEEDLSNLIDEMPRTDLSIIDGMQRTTALMQAVKENPQLTDKKMRVEYWVAPNTNNLIYRMLVLNTGQVPWNMRRQIEVVFRSMVQEIKEAVQGLEVLEIGDRRRRRAAGQFQAHNLVELFLVFGARKTTIDTQERLADEFTRLDFIEATSESSFTELFYEILGFLKSLDVAFGKYVSPQQNDDADADIEGLDTGTTEESMRQTQKGQRFRDGKDLFGSNTARVGFVVSVAEKLLGRPGMQWSDEKHYKRREEVKRSLTSVVERLEEMQPDQIRDFLDFDTLNQVIAVQSSKVGEWERTFFKTAFGVLIEESTELSSMTPCWRAS